MPSHAALLLALLGFRDVHTSAPLSAWDLGRARMYLESAATACTLSTKQHLDGEYPIALAIDPAGKARKVDVRGGRTMARCLRGILRDVRFPAAGGGYTWDGVLRVGLTSEALGVVVLRFDALSALHRDTVRNVILARLEDPPACAREALAGGSSAALHLELRAEADGKLAPPKVTLSTHAPDSLPPCLAAHLATLGLPASHTYTEVKMFFHLVQATDTPADGAVLVKEAE